MPKMTAARVGWLLVGLLVVLVLTSCCNSGLLFVALFK